MFCQFCGMKISDAAKFCPGCGNAVNVSVPPVQSTPFEDVIDLSGTVELSAPQEGKNKSLGLASVLMGLFWIAYAFLLKPWADFTGVDEGVDFGVYLLSSIFVTAPIGIIGLIATLISKKRTKLVTKMKKKDSFVIYLISWIICAFALGCGYATCFALGGLVGIILAVMTIAFAISYIYVGNVMAMQYGKEATYSFLCAFFSSFIPAIALGYLLGVIISAYIILLIVVVLLFVFVFGSFFANGGRIIYKNQ